MSEIISFGDGLKPMDEDDLITVRVGAVVDAICLMEYVLETDAIYLPDRILIETVLQELEEEMDKQYIHIPKHG